MKMKLKIRLLVTQESHGTFNVCETMQLPAVGSVIKFGLTCICLANILCAYVIHGTFVGHSKECSCLSL